MKKITILVAVFMAIVMGFYASSMPTYMISGGVIINRNRLQNAYAEEIADEEQTQTETVLETEYFDYTTNNVATLVEEATSKRTLTQKHYRMSDGSYVLQSYGAPIHYLKNDPLSGGSFYEDIDNTLQISTAIIQGLQSYSNAGNNFTVNFPTVSNSITGAQLANPYHMGITYDGDYFRMRMLNSDTLGGVNSVSATVVNPSDISTMSLSRSLTADEIPLVDIPSSNINYTGIIDGGISLGYEVNANSIAETITVSQQQDLYSFIFEIEVSTGITLTLSEGNEIIASDADGNVRFILSTPYMEDANGEMGEATYGLLALGDTFRITIEGGSWAGSSERSFPIEIKPIIEIINVKEDSIRNLQLYENDYRDGTDPKYIGVGCTTPFLGTLKQWKGFYIFDLNISHSMRYSISRAILSYEEFGWINNGTTVTYDVYVTENIEDISSVNWNTEIARKDKVYEGRLEGTWWFTERESVTFYFDPSLITSDEITFGFYPTSDANDYVRIDKDTVCLSLCYVQNVGIENSYTMESFEGSGFTNYVDVFSKQLTTVVDYMEVNNGVLPLTVTGIYSHNYDEFKKEILDEYFGFSEETPYKSYYGYDFKLNLEQYCVPYTIAGVKHYVYIDADGTPHILFKDANEDRIYNGDGYKFEENRFDEGTGFIYMNGVKCLGFKYGRLEKIYDLSGRFIEISHYNSSGNESIREVRFSDGIEELQTISFTYFEDSGFLKEIVSSYGEKTTFEYAYGHLKEVQRFDYEDNTTAPSVSIVYDQYDRIGSIKDNNGYGYRIFYSDIESNDVVTAYVSKVNTVYNDITTADVRFIDNVNNMRSVVYNNNVICDGNDAFVNAVKRYKFAWDGSVVSSSGGYDTREMPHNISMSRKEVIQDIEKNSSYAATEKLSSVPDGKFDISMGCGSWSLDNSVIENGALYLEGNSSASISINKSIEYSCITLYADGNCADCVLSVTVKFRTTDNSVKPFEYTVSVEQSGSYILIPILTGNLKQNEDNPIVDITIRNDCDCTVMIDNVCIQEMNASYTSEKDKEPNDDDNSQVVLLETSEGVTEQSYNEDGNIFESVYTPNNTEEKVVKTEYTYQNSDGTGNVIYIKQSEACVNSSDWILKAETTYIYDESTPKFLIEEISVLYDEDGIAYRSSVEYEYDSYGNVIRTIETDGSKVNKQYYTYSEVNKNLRLTKVLSCEELSVIGVEETHSAADYYTLYEYNDFGQLIKITDSKGITNEIVYDTTGKLQGFNTSDGEYRYTYGTNGNISSLTNGDITVISYNYDGSGMLTSKTYANGTGTESYVYNAYGNLTQLSIGSYVYTMAYDDIQRLTSVTNPSNLIYAFAYNEDNALSRYSVGGLKYSYSSSYTYNSDDTIENIKEEFGGINRTFTYIYTYDSDRNIDTIQLGSIIFDYSYDDLGRFVSRNLRSGSTIYSNITYNYADYQDDGSYNISQRVSSVTDTANPANNRYYMYDAYGNVTAIYKNESYSTVEVRYNYDSASRLIKEYVSSNDYTDYTYDGSGNITQSYKYTNNTFAWTSDKDVYTYDTNGRLVQLTNTYTMTRHNSGGEITPVLPTGSRAIGDQYVQTNYYFAYDALGNPIKYKVSSLEAANNLVWTGRKLTSGNLNNNVFAYTYDAYGVRVSKTVNGLKTNYYVSGSTIIAEERLNANGGVETFIYYIYDASGIAGLFVNNSYYYFTKNLFGDIIGIKNEANELVGAYTYNAWGECTIKTNVDGIATLNPFRYRGYYYDSETGFYYLQTRYYDPEICRFISADDPEILGDLASVVGQLNLYAYCLNNPVMYTDETGYAVETIFDIISLGFSIADVIINPLDLWAWAGLAGDLIDLIPFVTGVGEAVKAGKGLRFLLAHADEGAFLFKNADNIIDFAKGADKVLDAGSDIVRTGQKHHVITRRIADRISELNWSISRNDYIVQALTLKDHCGFQKWHRDYQSEILNFLANDGVTEAAFKDFVNSIYARDEMIRRFGLYVPFL